MNRPRRSRVRSEFVGNLQTDQAVKSLGRRHKPDYWLLVFSALLLMIGLVVVYSISPGLAASQNISQNYFITKQLIAVGLGIVAFALASYLPISAWKSLARPLIWASLAGCLIVMVTPINALYPAHRWVRFGGFSFQVAELIKLTLLVWMAAFLSSKWREGKLADSSAVLKPLLIILLVLGFVMAKLQSDLGSAAVIVSMMGLMAYAVGIPLKRISIIAVLVLALAGIAISTSGYRRERFNSFLHPESNCQSSGYQECQALIAVGSGGIMGLGLGYSVQAYGYLPQASNDSIFAIIAEKFGFIGTVLILVIYTVFITRIKNVVEHTSDQFSRLLAVGVLAWLSTQMIINIGAMLGLLPLKGITLPLVSQGGTSIIFIAIALGLVFQISRYTSYSVTEPENIPQKSNRSHYSFDGGRVRRPHNPAFVARPRT